MFRFSCTYLIICTDITEQTVRCRRIESECVEFGGVDEGCKVIGIMARWEVSAACFDFTLHRKGELQVYALA